MHFPQPLQLYLWMINVKSRNVGMMVWRWSRVKLISFTADNHQMVTQWYFWHGPPSRWRHQMETYFHITGPLWGKPPVNDGFPSQRPVTRTFGVFFELHLNKRLSKQSRSWWLETPSRSLWCYCNVITTFQHVCGFGPNVKPCHHQSSFWLGTCVTRINHPT